MKKRPHGEKGRSELAAAPPAETGPPPDKGSRPPAAPFPIVGIGASAGGLEALERFLKNVPAGSGMAYVIIQHLDPTHKGIMVELLQRATPMPVVQARDRMKVEPDHAYVIPPNKDMSILHGVLHLLTPVSPRGLRLPIDYFFRALAQDCKDKSIGVILSGMGSDGTLGLRTIKEMAGAVFVQEPGSAKFDGMPRSAIDAGLADVVAPVEELPGRIIDYLRFPSLAARQEISPGEKVHGALDKIFLLLRTQTGHDFSLYKKSTLYRRIERRMSLHQTDRIATYVRFLQENPQETQLLFKELLIGVTGFFRDPAAWEQLKEKAIPALLAAYPQGGTLRAWTPGCSTGEEAYSLAIVFREALARRKSAGIFTLQIFATDLDKDAIDKARAAVYPANIAADISPERLQRFFIQEEQGYRVGREIREAVVFAPQNVIMDPPFTKLDLLVCRNLLIYLTPELQKKLLPVFHYSLRPGGILFLGSAETIGNLTGLFAPLDAKARLYRRLDTAPGAEPVEFPTSFSSPSPAAPAEPRAQRTVPNIQTLVDQVLLTHYTPAAVLTSAQGDILYINGRTGRYLEPAAGKANWNLFAMAHEGIRYELTGAFQKALRENQTVILKGLKVGTNGGEQLLDMTIRPLAEPEALRETVLVVFSDLPAAPPRRRRAKAGAPLAPAERFLELQQECEQSRHELQSTREEMQASQEELKAMNEELQSNNEELQSTNEELMTSKEEMQSMNEELQTVNQELQAKVTDLSQVNSDMKNLLDSTDIATLFLDDMLNVRRFTSRAAQIIKLIPGDAGRPITDITSGLIYPEFAADAREVIRSLSIMEKEVASADGRWFWVRIMPYRTLENRIDGLVITFADISRAKTLETQLRKAQAAPERCPGERTAAPAGSRRKGGETGQGGGKQTGAPAPRRPGKKKEAPA